MQVANTLNNNIRILFNPKVEDFKLFDFLIVKSNEDRYIAQIIQIYDDKFDSSQNVAKLKLFYKVTKNNEVMPYDNFTPNKECEIIKIKQDELETFINQEKETFIFGTNAKSQTALNVQYDFFNKSVVLADKIEHVGSITFNLAKNLSTKRNVVIIDSTGILEFQDAKKIKASLNFKLPLNYTTIDYVFEKCLPDSSLEFQATGTQILNEIKKFARNQEKEFIPFNAFTRVLMEQYKVTPYAELKLLLARLKKMQMDEIFARTKKDKDALFNVISKNNITIIDLSSVDSYWQKAYLEYITSEIQDEVYLISRVNDENFDVDLINKIYCQKQNINFIPNVSYNYKKLPSLLQFCKNYILMPSLYQRNDFLDANLALSNLISDGCILFGENTDNFLYLARDWELEQQEKRKNYRKIALSWAKQDEETEQNLGKAGDYFENKEKEEKLTDSQFLIDELSAFDSIRQKEIQNSEKDIDEEFVELENPNEKNDEKENNFKEIIKEENEEDEFTSLQNETEQEENFEQIEEKEKIQENDDLLKVESESSSENLDEIEIRKEEEILIENEKNIEFVEIGTETIEEAEKKEDSEQTPKKSILDTELIGFDDEEPVKETTFQIREEEDENQKLTEEKAPEINEKENVKAETGEVEEDMNLSDDELDFFQIAQDSSEEFENQEENNNNDDDIDLNEIANNSIDSSFEKIVNSKKQQEDDLIKLDNDTKINADILNQPVKNENLPIFKEEKAILEETITYKIGQIVIHKKYGRGSIIKTIKYEERQLLQIEFEEAGKKLLDPKVADIKLEQ